MSKKLIAMIAAVVAMLVPLQCSTLPLSQFASNNHYIADEGESQVVSKEQQNLINKLQKQYPEYSKPHILLVDASEQELSVFNNGVFKKSYSISTGTNGLGSLSGSGKTPLGAHRISETYGDGAPLGAIFKARKNTGKIAEILTAAVDVPEDHVTTRIMWLSGLEKGKNQGGNVDSHSRYIYIHGTPEEGLIGRPASHGCIRMINSEVIELFDQVGVDTLVYIIE